MEKDYGVKSRSSSLDDCMIIMILICFPGRTRLMCVNIFSENHEMLVKIKMLLAGFFQECTMFCVIFS